MSLTPYLQALRAHAELVACPRPRCLRPAGQTCVSPRGVTYSMQAAHDERVDAADTAAALVVDCPDDWGCGQVAGEVCIDDRFRFRSGKRPFCEARARAAGVWREPLVLDDEPPQATSAAARSRRSYADGVRLRELRGDERAGDISWQDRLELDELEQAGRAGVDETPPPPSVPAARGGASGAAAGPGRHLRALPDPPDDDLSDDPPDFRMGPGNRSGGRR